MVPDRGAPRESIPTLRPYRVRTRSRGESNGAGGRDRTDDLRFTRPLLCQLSYPGVGPQVTGASVRRPAWRRRATACSAIAAAADTLSDASRPYIGIAAEHVAPLPRESGQPSTLGTEDERDRRVGDREVVDVGGPVAVEPDGPHARPAGPGRGSRGRRRPR